jgi:hypothetical protein
MPGACAQTTGIAWIAGIAVAYQVGEVVSPGRNSTFSFTEANARIVHLIEILGR